MSGESFYCLMRFYQILYERLKKAKAVMETHVDDAAARRMKFSPTPSETEEKLDYDWVKNTVYALINNEIDISAYEDDLRKAMGTEAYSLFTVDKLLSQMVKLLQGMVNDPNTLRIASLYLAYRDILTTRAAVDSYEKECRTIVGDAMHFRIRWDLRSRELTIRMVTPADYWHTTPPEDRPVMTACDGEVLKYCLSYMGPYTLVSDHINFATQIPDPRHATAAIVPYVGELAGDRPVRFLRRNRRRVRRRDGDYPPRSDSAVPPAKERRHHYKDANIAMHNGLCCRMPLHSYRLAYVPNTHDVLLRPRHRKRAAERGAAGEAKRLRRFQHWLSMRLVDAERQPFLRPIVPIKEEADTTMRD